MVLSLRAVEGLHGWEEHMKYLTQTMRIFLDMFAILRQY